MIVIRGLVILILRLPFKLISLANRRVGTSIHASTFEGKPSLGCNFGNYGGTEPIAVIECHLVVDGQHLSMPYRNFGMLLPRTVLVNEGFGFSFDPVPLLTNAREGGKASFKVRGFFQDNAGRTYLSRPLKIYTDAKRFNSRFEDQEYLSKPSEKTFQTAHQIAEELGQQLVGIPHIILALVREQNSVGGMVLRELGMDEDFMLDLAKNSPNFPRDPRYPSPYMSTEAQQLGEYTADEARKMRQKCHGTGHLLLGLTRQKDAAFVAVLEHLDITPRQMRAHVYEVLRKDQNQMDHPTPPPEGVERYVWASGYTVAHAIYVTAFHALMRLFPDAEF